jgi:hypothetical protein
VHVGQIDGDEIMLEVVYCDKVQDTCVAVAVPVKFPHHCDTAAEVDAAILELEVLCNREPVSYRDYVVLQQS